MNTQYKKGVLELCVLSLLHKRDCYGYEISECLSRHIDIADGTVYPILRKLKADGLLTTYLQEESGGPPRKNYRLTELGRETYQNDRAEYLRFAQSVRNLLEDRHGGMQRKGCAEAGAGRGDGSGPRRHSPPVCRGDGPAADLHSAGRGRG